MDISHSLFPIKERYAYFMSAASGPLPLPTHQALVAFSQLLLKVSSVDFNAWLEAVEATRKASARLLDCDKNSVAFVKNTGVGLWIASRMVDWHKGDQVLLPRAEFPSNIYPWLSLEQYGVKIIWIEPSTTDGSEHPIPKVTPETIAPLVTERTRLLSVSFVQFDDGARRDIKALGRFCKEKNIVFVVDAIQGLGALPFSCRDSAADFVAAGSQKWLLAPPGTGLLYVKPEWLETTRVPNLGWLS
ncbi:MAG: aminotransferase class V-fold PLP-dependent enzyme, partial [Candidatus Obscuribacterales bacterium]|nr:aminotransferase class V-fold PLP-dependent enzyme [Candidatus Obscuribacterales bacterium]